MEEHLQKIEEIFLRADYSKESALKAELERKLFSVNKMSLDKLMKEEGMNIKVELQNKSAQKSRTGSLEHISPKIKKGKKKGI
ncbi:hypothetical protein QYZ88_013795 [Lachnospiraceae bacterium C1.1]|nr:hypothetical protein [Lachnospiraceae bacterium C1.1]